MFLITGVLAARIPEGAKMFFSRPTASLFQAFEYPMRTIELEQTDGGPTMRGESGNVSGHESEVPVPRLCTRVEERYDQARRGIDGGNVTAFVAIAESTRQRQIFAIGLAAVFECDDVIDLVFDQAQ